MKLYHASTFIVKFPDVQHSRDFLDFGRGFYLTSMREQAVKYALRFTLRGKKAYINEYIFNEDELRKYRIKSFKKYDEERLDYVAKCRKGIQENQFDVVEGGIANDRVFNTVDLYFSGAMSKSDALGRLAFEHPNHQLCIKNQEVITNHLHFTGAEEMTRERMYESR